MDRLAHLDVGAPAARPGPGLNAAPVPAIPVPAQVDAVVVGGGWAGLAAAVELAEAGRRVTLFDSAPQLGGRARGLLLRLGDIDVPLDNGQHLLMGAYRDTLSLARSLGVPVSDAPGRGAIAPGLLRHPLELTAVDGLRVRAAALPAPFHLAVGLARARGLTVRERVSAVSMMLRLQLAGWRTRPGETVDALLSRFAQPDRVRRLLWEPVALGALNTPVALACAATFVRVLRDTLGGRAEAADFVLPSGTLAQVLPEPAARRLTELGARVALRSTVRGLTPGDGGWTVRADSGSLHARELVLAVPPRVAARLLEPLDMPEPGRRIVEALERFTPAAIATVYLAWPGTSGVRLPRWILLDEREDPDAPGQWLFDRGEHGGLRVGAVVVSAAAPGLDGARLARSVGAQVARQLRLPQPAHARAIVEKRATFLCTPDRPRLEPWTLARACASGATAWSRLMLAGDYACPDYPATLEAAVRSGGEAARTLAALPG